MRSTEPERLSTGLSIPGKCLPEMGSTAFCLAYHDSFLQTVNQLGGDFTEPRTPDSLTNDLLRALLKLQTNPGLLKFILTES